MSYIPDNEILFRYARENAFPNDQSEIPPSLFQDISLSCDWEKYQKKPEDSFHVAEGKNVIISIITCDEIRHPRNPKRNGQIVQDWIQNIYHCPEECDPIHGPNLAHSLIEGRKKMAVVKAIQKHSNWKKAEIDRKN